MRGYNEKVDVIVYTMGKVGSSTVSTSVRAAGLRCLDVHFLASDRLTKMLAKYLNDPDIQYIPEHIIDSILARNVIERDKKVKIISLMRNPIMRNISAVFQNTPQRLEDSPDEIMKRLRAYKATTPDMWFRRDFIPTTGIDIFDMEIDGGADHFQFSSGKFKVLLLKLETDDARKSKLISDFLGKKVSLTRINEAEKKWYRDIYRKVIENPAGIRKNYLAECARLKYFQTFYSEEERRLLLEAASPEAVGAD